jgi:hypothetical protein
MGTVAVSCVTKEGRAVQDRGGSSAGCMKKKKHVFSLHINGDSLTTYCGREAAMKNLYPMQKFIYIILMFNWHF